MKTLAEKIKVMQAALEGKKIRWVNVLYGMSDVVLDDDPAWNWVRYDYDIVPEPKRVPLGPGDVPPGSVVRCTNQPVGVWYAPVGAFINGLHILGGAGKCELIEWPRLSDLFEISRDGGKTWQPCWKEVEA